MRSWRFAAGFAVLAGVAIVALSFPLLAEDEKDDDGIAEKVSALLKEAKITLTDAIRKAEEKAGGTAFLAGLEKEDGKTIFEVVVLKKGESPELVEVEIDAKTGEVIKTESPGAEDDDEGDEDDDDDEGDDDDDDDDDDDEDDD